MEINKEEQNNTEKTEIFYTLKDNISIFNKNYQIQTFFFVILVVALFLIIYVTTYNDIKLLIINSGTLPKDLKNVGYTGYTMVIIAFFAFLFPIDTKIFQIHKIRKTEKLLLKYIKENLRELKFEKNIELIEEYLYSCKNLDMKVEKKVEIYLERTKTNQLFRNKIDDIWRNLHENKLLQASEILNEIGVYLYHPYKIGYIAEQLYYKFNELEHLVSQKQAFNGENISN